jgi:hypothetical protein
VTPVETLVAAADRIRDLAAHYHAGEGDWEKRHESWLYWSLDRQCPEHARRWIAALSPAAAPGLEALLRAAAHDVTVSGMTLNAVQFKAALADRFAPALDLAKAVLCSGVDTHG